MFCQCFLNVLWIESIFGSDGQIDYKSLHFQSDCHLTLLGSHLKEMARFCEGGGGKWARGPHSEHFTLHERDQQGQDNWHRLAHKPRHYLLLNYR